MNKIQGLLRSTRAATAVEYGLILALVFLAALGAISAVGNGTITMWNKVSSNATRVL
jgi:pilus assembly protein Flp/PilA